MTIPADKACLRVFFAIFFGIIASQIAMQFIYYILITPLIVSATITQDFKSAFNFNFAKNFLTRTWKESTASIIFIGGLGLCELIIMLITCYVGVLFAMPVVMFSSHHLQKQLYQLYLERGGEPLPRSPKLLNVQTQS